MAGSSSAPRTNAPRTTFGAVTHELDELRDEAAVLVSMYESDDAVPEMLEKANVIGARAYRIAAALGQIAEGLAQL